MVITLRVSNLLEKFLNFSTRYINLGGWVCHIENYPLNKKDASLFMRDILGNLKACFKSHKTYVKRDNYFLTILPTKKYLIPLNLIVMPFFLLHELTHALAMYFELSLEWIIMLPMVTEVPFFAFGMLSVHFRDVLPVWVTTLFLLVGSLGLASLDGDFVSWRYYKKSFNEYPDLASFFARV